MGAAGFVVTVEIGRQLVTLVLKGAEAVQEQPYHRWVYSCPGFKPQGFAGFGVG